jgi:hypothetical protein
MVKQSSHFYRTHLVAHGRILAALVDKNRGSRPRREN